MSDLTFDVKIGNSTIRDLSIPQATSLAIALDGKIPFMIKGYRAGRLSYWVLDRERQSLAEFSDHCFERK